MIALPDSAPRLIARSGVVLLCVAVWYLTLAPSAVGGPLSLVLIRGTSMEPTYATGDLVIGYRTGTPEVGEVVVFRAPGGAPVIHRTREVADQRIVTRGDNLPVDDPWATGVDDVMGTARLHIPRVGPVIDTLARPPVMGGFAALTAMFLVIALRDRSEEDEDDGGGPGERGADRDPCVAGLAPTTYRPTPVGAAGPISGAVPAALYVAGTVGACLVLLVGSFAIAYAASVDVTVDEVASFQIPGPIDTYLLTPGGGPGGGRGGGRP